jgi:hypothetical protein
MTATTVFTPSMGARSWRTMQRVAAAVLMIVVFSALAFSIGRATAPVHHATPSIVPASVSVSTPSGAGVGTCRRGPC